MADYRLDCCGGFPSHRDGCRSVAEAPLREKQAKRDKEILDALYAKYGELIALSERHDNKNGYRDTAQGVLIAIRTIEGKPVAPF